MSDATTGTTGSAGEEATEVGTGADPDVVVVGAGFAGLYMLHRLRGLGLTVQVIEAGRRRRRHLVLEPLPGRALRHRERGRTPTRSSTEL